MAPFSAEGFPDCLVTIGADSLSIGSIDSIQRLHVQTLPLGEQPRRMALDPGSGTICLATVSEVPEDAPGTSGADGYILQEQHRVHLLDARSLERLHTVDLLGEHAQATSVKSWLSQR